MPHYDALPNPSTAREKELPLQKIEPVFDSDSNSTNSFTSPRHFTWQSGLVDKLLLLCASLLPVVASTYLLVTTTTDRSSTGPLLSFVLNNRATTQIVVSLISGALAALNVYALTKLLNLATRIHLLRQSLSLNMISFIRAISTKSLAASLPAAMFTTSIIIVLAFALPNTLWTGALTPVLTNTSIDETGILKIPRFSTSSNSTWSVNERPWLIHSVCHTVSNKEGIFSDCPISILQSSLLSRAAQATSNENLTHSKSDNSHYSYVGRSFGVGSSVGLIDGNLYSKHSSSNILFYNYTELGYIAHTTYFHNASSDFHLQEIQVGKPHGIPYIYYAIGLFPNKASNQDADYFSVIGVFGDADLAVVAAKRYAGRNVILVTAGSNYARLNSTQCDVYLAPTAFSVGVNVADKLMTVLPMTNERRADSPPSFDPTGGLATTIMNQINGLGMSSTSLYTSVVGDALESNIRAASANSSSSEPSLTFGAMADSFSVMVDEILLSIASIQLFIPNVTIGNSSIGDFSFVDAHLTVQAIRLGEAKYVMAAFAMCAALMATVVIEAFRTKIWRSLPKWDFMDTTCLVLASAVAGQDVVNKMCQGQGGRQLEWTGGGDVLKEKEQVARDDWGCGTRERVLRFRLKLGMKALRIKSAQQARDGYGDGREVEGGGREVWLAAVSLWTSGAKDVVPLA